jgi:hypothetical protein
MKHTLTEVSAALFYTRKLHAFGTSYCYAIVHANVMSVFNRITHEYDIHNNIFFTLYNEEGINFCLIYMYFQYNFFISIPYTSICFSIFVGSFTNYAGRRVVENWTHNCICKQELLFWLDMLNIQICMFSSMYRPKFSMSSLAISLDIIVTN